MPAKRTKLGDALSVASGKIPPMDPPVAPPVIIQGQNYLAPSRQGKKAITAHFDPAVAKQLKQLALDRDTTIQNLFGEALNDLFIKHGKSPIA